MSQEIFLQCLRCGRVRLAAEPTVDSDDTLPLEPHRDGDGNWCPCRTGFPRTDWQCRGCGRSSGCSNHLFPVRADVVCAACVQAPTPPLDSAQKILLRFLCAGQSLRLSDQTYRLDGRTPVRGQVVESLIQSRLLDADLDLTSYGKTVGKAQGWLASARSRPVAH